MARPDALLVEDLRRRGNRGAAEALVGTNGDRVYRRVPHHRERGLPEGGEAGDVVAAVQTAMFADLPYPKVRDAILAHPAMTRPQWPPGHAPTLSVSCAGG
jgi:hypothetical protein